MKEKVKEKRRFSAFEWVSMILIAVLMTTVIITAILIANLHDKKKSLEHENEEIQTDTNGQGFDEFVITNFDNQLQ